MSKEINLLFHSYIDLFIQYGRKEKSTIHNYCFIKKLQVYHLLVSHLDDYESRLNVILEGLSFW